MASPADWSNLRLCTKRPEAATYMICETAHLVDHCFLQACVTRKAALADILIIFLTIYVGIYNFLGWFYFLYIAKYPWWLIDSPPRGIINTSSFGTSWAFYWDLVCIKMAFLESDLWLGKGNDKKWRDWTNGRR
jgi:hypothetical protein